MSKSKNMFVTFSLRPKLCLHVSFLHQKQTETRKLWTSCQKWRREAANPDVGGGETNRCFIISLKTRLEQLLRYLRSLMAAALIRLRGIIFHYPSFTRISEEFWEKKKTKTKKPWKCLFQKSVWAYFPSVDVPDGAALLLVLAGECCVSLNPQPHQLTTGVGWLSMWSVIWWLLLCKQNWQNKRGIQTHRAVIPLHSDQCYRSFPATPLCFVVLFAAPICCLTSYKNDFISRLFSGLHEERFLI